MTSIDENGYMEMNMRQTAALWCKVLRRNHHSPFVEIRPRDEVSVRDVRNCDYRFLAVNSRQNPRKTDKNR